MTPGRPLLPRSKLDLLRRLLSGPATTAELAKAAKLHPTVVRRHLQELVLAGYAEASPLSGDRGRPTMRYRVLPAGRELFFARYDVVLESVARALLARRGGEDAPAVFARAGAELARRQGAPKTLEEVVQISREIGFEPEVRQERGSPPVLLSHNCPILTVAKEHPELTCDAFHCALVGGWLGTSPRPLRQAISRGADYCVHELEATA